MKRRALGVGWGGVLLFAAVISMSVLFAQGQRQDCTSSNRTSYLRSQENKLSGQDSGSVIRGISLNECGARCTNTAQSGIECGSFEYNDALKTCALSTASVQPFGPATLIAATDPSDAFYQQICIPSSEVCDAPFSFERVPQRVLVGFALEVTPAAGVSECLMNCLEASRRFRVECKSVMYYYETLECIINREDRRNRPDLFSTDTQGFIVDYFENNCAGSSAGHFPCKAFMVDESRNLCFLANERALPRGRAELVPDSSVDYYEKICLSSSRRCATGQQAFVRVGEKVLVGFADDVREVPSLAECLDACLDAPVGLCKSVAYFYDKAECILNNESRFTRPELFGDEKDGYRVDYFDNTCQDGNTGGGISPTTIPFPTPDPNIGIGGTTGSTTTDPGTKGTLETQCRYDGIFIRVTFSQSTTGHMFVRNQFPSCRADFVDAADTTLVIPLPAGVQDGQPPPANAGGQPLSLNCQGTEIEPGVWSYMVVVQKNGFGVPGLMTSNDRIFNITCDYSESTVTVPATGSATVGGGPPGTNLVGSGTSNIAPSIRMVIVRDGRPVTSVLLGEELDLTWEIVQPVPGMGFLIRDCTAERLGGNPPHPSPVKLITGGCPDPSVSDRLITSQVNEITNGFQTKMQMFRFDGSRSVRMRCTIDMCIERCRPVNCNVNGRVVSSMGRRRRKRQHDDVWRGGGVDIDVNDAPPVVYNSPFGRNPDHRHESLGGGRRADAPPPSVAAETTLGGDVVENDIISGVFTIVDRLHDGDVKFHKADGTSTDFRRQYSTDTRSVIRRDGNICLIRPLFVTIFGLLGMLCIAEGTIVILYYYAKHCRPNEHHGVMTSLVSWIQQYRKNRGQTNGDGSSKLWYGSLQRLIQGKMHGLTNQLKGRNAGAPPTRFPGTVASSTAIECQESVAYASTSYCDETSPNNRGRRLKAKGCGGRQNTDNPRPLPSDTDDTSVCDEPSSSRRRVVVATARVEQWTTAQAAASRPTPPLPTASPRKAAPPPAVPPPPPPPLPPKSAAIRAKQQPSKQLPPPASIGSKKTPPRPPKRRDSLPRTGGEAGAAADSQSEEGDKSRGWDSDRQDCSASSSEHYMAAPALHHSQDTDSHKKKVHFVTRRNESSSSSEESSSLGKEVGTGINKYRDAAKIHSLAEEVKTRLSQEHLYP